MISVFPDVFILKPKLFIDNRGSFMESFNLKEIQTYTKRKIDFCQDNQVFSKKGVIRGMHYQLPPFSQSKLVRVTQGKVLDVIIDIRKGSTTFGKYFSKELSAENQLQLFVPRGFAHGYITLSETSIFHYKVDQYYHPQSEESIAPDDPDLGIDWKISETDWIQSEKDKKYSRLSDANLFDYNHDLYA